MIKYNKKELAIGTEMEMEHTKSKKRAETIAKHHLIKYPNYYTSLKKMEKSLTVRTK